jgi:proline iminopeptidase
MASAAVPIEHAEECLVEVPSATTTLLDSVVSPRIQLWCRSWGNRDSGKPVLFVHGGPGNCIASYDNINKDFFDSSVFFVVEVDQRGTGKSQPSVMDPVEGVHNMQLYRDISLQQMSSDFEVVRKQFGIHQWLVFGGSWGSTLALDYAIRFPENCLGLIVRGIFLGTAAEQDCVYARKAFAGQDSDVKRRQLKDFDTFYQYVNKHVELRRGVEGNQEAPLDADDPERIMREYESLILQGDRIAAWHCFAFEENLMVEEESSRLDYERIDEEQYAEAQSVAFFEMRLFVRLAYEEPPNLLARLYALANVKTWVVQGLGDNVCPQEFAKDLVTGLENASVQHKAYFVDAGHKSGSQGIKKALQQCVHEFAEGAANKSPDPPVVFDDVNKRAKLHDNPAAPPAVKGGS